MSVSTHVMLNICQITKTSRTHAKSNIHKKNIKVIKKISLIFCEIDEEKNLKAELHVIHFLLQFAYGIKNMGK